MSDSLENVLSSSSRKNSNLVRPPVQYIRLSGFEPFRFFSICCTNWKNFKYLPIKVVKYNYKTIVILKSSVWALLYFSFHVCVEELQTIQKFNLNRWHRYPLQIISIVLHGEQTLIIFWRRGWNTVLRRLIDIDIAPFSFHATSSKWTSITGWLT